jgi:hypothetical protein
MARRRDDFVRFRADLEKPIEAAEEASVTWWTPSSRHIIVY